jgi:dipeptidyl-peptidase 4
MKNWILIATSLLTMTFVTITEGVAQKDITVEDIWSKGTFRTKGVSGFNFMKDGKHYAKTEGKRIVKMDITTGKEAGTVYESPIEFEDYAFNSDESKILLATEGEAIYRRSSRAFYKIWDGKTVSDLYPNLKQNNPQFNPQGTMVAFTADNNLYVKDLQSGNVRQLTTDGKNNHIINGFCDWVYEEELSFTRAFEWSPDGTTIAFLRFDETAVPEFSMEYHENAMYPRPYKFKYPKVGEKNSTVTAWLVNVLPPSVKKGKKAQNVALTPVKGLGNYEYIPRLRWTPAGKLIVFRMNRLQNELDLMQVDAKTGMTEDVLVKETSNTFVDVEMNDDLSFLKDGSFIKSSERDGWNHIYYHNAKGAVVRQLTKGDYDVRKIIGMDEKRGLVYYQASKESPMKKGISAVKIDGTGDNYLVGGSGSNDAEFSANFDYFVLTHSTINEPPTITVMTNDAKPVRVIEDNAKMRQQIYEYACSRVVFKTIKTTEGVELNAFMVLPMGFDSTKKYPVFMTQYSGPNSQQVLDQWRGTNYWWEQLLTKQGYIVVCVDPRGTGGRGVNFRKITYKKLGFFETVDQIESAKYLSNLPFVDGKRIGIFGWSYGGYMASSCILKGNDVFKAAIAVAPVTNWKWYDSIYTERYMQTEKENADGYKDNSPVNFVDRLTGNFLLIHGMADDNVHFQHSVEMANALINANKQFDTYFYPNRNHGIYGGYARLHLYNKMLSFLKEKL